MRVKLASLAARGAADRVRLFAATATAKPTISIAELSAGDKKSFPVPGDMVEVHYVGTLAANGKLFDSSRKRGEPFRFRVGDGMVIPGWELSLQKMSLGEKSNVRIPSHLGYDAQEIPGVIPAHSELQFEIELLNIYRPLKPVVFEQHVHGPGCGHSH